MAVEFIKETQDDRGKIFWFMHGNTEIHLVETKMNSARRGHYHPYDSIHVLILGKMIYKECDRNYNSGEIKRVVESGSWIYTRANRAHMFSALEESLLLEIFPCPYGASDFPPYRNEIDQSWNTMV